MFQQESLFNYLKEKYEFILQDTKLKTVPRSSPFQYATLTNRGIVFAFAHKMVYWDGQGIRWYYCEANNTLYLEEFKDDTTNKS